jgi:hypothetical protein
VSPESLASIRARSTRRHAPLAITSLSAAIQLITLPDLTRQDLVRLPARAEVDVGKIDTGFDRIGVEITRVYGLGALAAGNCIWRARSCLPPIARAAEHRRTERAVTGGAAGVLLGGGTRHVPRAHRPGDVL